MLSPQEQVQLSGQVATRLVRKDPDLETLEAWHIGIEAIRLHEPDYTQTEGFIELSTISYRAVEYGSTLLGNLPVSDRREIIANSSDIMTDLAKNRVNQSRRCGGYLLTAPALRLDVPIMELCDDRLRVPDAILGLLEEQPAFDNPDLLPTFWQVAADLTQQQVQ